jgi:hypothetical protein
MARVSLSDTQVRVDLEGLHQLWALTRRITVPLAHVRGATADPGVVVEVSDPRAVVDAVNGALAGTAPQAPAESGVFRPVDGGSVRAARLRG